MRLCVSCGNGLQGSDWTCERCGWNAPVHSGIRRLTRTQEGSAVRFSPREFESLYALEQDYFWFRGRTRLILWAVFQRDYPVVQGTILFVSLLFMLSNLVVDLIYAYVDPRIRYG